MTENSLFYQKLKKDYPDLLELIQKNNFVILEPKRNLIEKSILTKNFYCNHILFKSSYNESIYVNLNGKVLKYENSKFTTYLGWKKEMVLPIKESSKLSDDIQCFQLDNICDENSYSEAKVSSNKINMQKMKSMNDYKKYNETLLKSNQVYKKAFEKLTIFINDMKKNYMFMKGYEEDYSKIFIDREYKLIKKFTDILKNPNDEYNVSYNITKELVDSLIFSDLHSYLFRECLVKFYKEDEKKIREYLKANPSKYDWDGMKIDEIYYKCKFEEAIIYLDNITSKKTIFEKKEVLNEVNNLIIKEAKSVFESQQKKNFILDGKDLQKFWMYIIAHVTTKNMFAEAQFLNLFGGKGTNPKDLIAKNFSSAAKNIMDDILKNDEILSQYIEPNKINLNKCK